MTEITINRTCAIIDRCEQFTSGRVGARIKFSFSPEWAGLSKTAVFTNGDTTIDVLNVADEITIPHEVLAISGKKLKVGVYGYTVGDNDNIEIAIPTVYADLGKVVKGADPSGDESTEPSLPVWAQIQSDVSDLDARVTELEEHGSGGGSSIALDTTLTQSGKAADAKAVGDALNGKQNTISDLEAIRTGAAKGATALQSVPSTYRTASEQDTIDDGKVDKVTGKGLSSNDYTDAAKAKVDALAPVATSGSYNDLTNKPTIPTALPNPNALTFTGAVTGSYDGSEALTVEIPSGGSGGTDISLGLTSAAVGQIIKVKAIDESGKPTAWDAANMPSVGGGGSGIGLYKFIQTVTIPDGENVSIVEITIPAKTRKLYVSGKTNTSSTFGTTVRIYVKNGNIILASLNSDKTMSHRNALFSAELYDDIQFMAFSSSNIAGGFNVEYPGYATFNDYASWFAKDNNIFQIMIKSASSENQYFAAGCTFDLYAACEE